MTNRMFPTLFLFPFCVVVVAFVYVIEKGIPYSWMAVATSADGHLGVL